MAAISGMQFSGANSASYVNQASSSNTGQAQATSQPQAATLKSDTVKLSLAAHIKQMHMQGYSTSVIASQLGISAKQVATYLPSLAQAATAASTTAAATPSVPSQAETAAPAAPAGAK